MHVSTCRKLIGGLAMVVVALLCAATVSQAQPPAGRPNIVVIFGDDIGMWNVGAHARHDGPHTEHRSHRQ